MSNISMDAPLEDLEISRLAENLGPWEWRKLGLYLHVPEAKLANLEKQYHYSLEEAAVKMLFMWHNNQDPWKERELLIAALTQCRLRNLAERLQTGEFRRGAAPVPGMRPVFNNDVNQAQGPPCAPPQQLRGAAYPPQQPQGAGGPPHHEITEVKLRDLSRKLGAEWKAVGTYLHVSTSEIQVLQEQFPLIKECIFQMLLQWRNTKGTSATKEKLKRALSKAEREELKDFIDRPDDQDTDSEED